MRSEDKLTAVISVSIFCAVVAIVITGQLWGRANDAARHQERMAGVCKCECEPKIMDEAAKRTSWWLTCAHAAARLLLEARKERDHHAHWHDHFGDLSDKLEAERDQLSEDLDREVHRRDQFAGEAGELEEERDAALAEIGKIARQLGQCQAERDAALAEAEYQKRLTQEAFDRERLALARIAELERQAAENARLIVLFRDMVARNEGDYFADSCLEEARSDLADEGLG